MVLIKEPPCWQIYDDDDYDDDDSVMYVSVPLYEISRAWMIEWALPHFCYLLEVCKYLGTFVFR
jgi:hypothetical protein